MNVLQMNRFKCSTYVKASALAVFSLLQPLTTQAQTTLSLDSCRAMALRNNKQIGIAREKQIVAENVRKAARTQYLPRVTAMGSYLHTSKEMSILSDDQKGALSNIGTNIGEGFGQMKDALVAKLPELIKDKIISLEQAQFIQKLMPGLEQGMASVAQGFNEAGQSIVDAFRTDTRNVYAVSVMATMPVYTGGRIVAANRMADISEQLAAANTDSQIQNTIYDIDNAYWMVVSLRQKQKLAESFVNTLKKLDDDVQKMIAEGVATKSDGLQVNVKLNEAEMLKLKVDNGLSLSRMLLCQLCGLDLNSDINLVDENLQDISLGDVEMDASMEAVFEARPEVRMLESMVGLSEQSIKMARASNLPTLMVAGGYSATNPNVFNSFQKKFGGMWSVGAVLTIPVLNWGEGCYKTRAAKATSRMASLEVDEAKEMIELQISQSKHKLTEARERLSMATKNIQKADENLRSANLGYREGIISSTTLLQAQTAWLEAQSQKLDAQIDVRLAIVNLNKSLGRLY